MSVRSSLLTLIGVACVLWAGLLLFTYFVRPQSLLAYMVFFLLLSSALTSTLAPVIYSVGRWLFARRIYRYTLRQSFRQSAFLALVIVFNLMLSVLHSWNLFTGLMILAAAGVMEFLTLAGGSGRTL